MCRRAAPSSRPPPHHGEPTNGRPRLQCPSLSQPPHLPHAPQRSTINDRHFTPTTHWPSPPLTALPSLSKGDASAGSHHTHPLSFPLSQILSAAATELLLRHRFVTAFRALVRPETGPPWSALHFLPPLASSHAPEWPEALLRRACHHTPMPSYPRHQWSMVDCATPPWSTTRGPSTRDFL
jgi:hypothetical protein